MNLPTENQQSRGPVNDRLVDRLVDGELPDVERRELLLRFENEPGGWRRCALAFLEGQNWRQAFSPLVASESTRPMGVQDARSRKPRPWRVVARLTGLAAGLAAAFALGRSFHGGPEKATHSGPVAQQAASSESQQSAPVKLPAGELKPSKPAELALLDPLLKSWEQRGYSVESQQRLVSMELNDGRKLNVPVRVVRFRYIGNRTY